MSLEILDQLEEKIRQAVETIQFTSTWSRRIKRTKKSISTSGRSVATWKRAT